MPRQRLNLEHVRQLAMKLPGVEESTIHGAPAWKVRGKLLACTAMHKSAEADSLVVKLAAATVASLLTENPERYYLTEHYQNSSVVLVRLAQIDRKSLESLLRLSWDYLCASHR